MNGIIALNYGQEQMMPTIVIYTRLATPAQYSSLNIFFSAALSASKPSIAP